MDALAKFLVIHELVLLNLYLLVTQYAMQGIFLPI